MLKLLYIVLFCTLLGCQENKTSSHRTVSSDFLPPPPRTKTAAPNTNIIFLDSIESTQKAVMVKAITEYFNFYKIDLDSNPVFIKHGGFHCHGETAAEQTVMYTSSDTIYVCQNFTRMNVAHECGHLIKSKVRILPKQFALENGVMVYGVKGLSILVRMDGKESAFNWVNEAACEFLAHAFASGINETYTVESPVYAALGSALVRALRGKSDLVLQCIRNGDLIKLHNELFPQEKTNDEAQAISGLARHFGNGYNRGNF